MKMSDHLREEINRAWSHATQASRQVYEFELKNIHRNIRAMEKAYRRALRVERRQERRGGAS